MTAHSEPDFYGAFVRAMEIKCKNQYFDEKYPGYLDLRSELMKEISRKFRLEEDTIRHIINAAVQSRISLIAVEYPTPERLQEKVTDAVITKLSQDMDHTISEWSDKYLRIMKEHDMRLQFVETHINTLMDKMRALEEASA